MSKKPHIYRKKWGQNFLNDTNLLDRIVRTLNPNKDDAILEIGPGEGSLTEKIFHQVKEMAAIEIDPVALILEIFILFMVMFCNKILKIFPFPIQSV